MLRCGSSSEGMRCDGGREIKEKLVGGTLNRHQWREVQRRLVNHHTQEADRVGRGQTESCRDAAQPCCQVAALPLKPDKC